MAHQAHKSRPVIGITMGDPVGIGPEIIVKALCDASLRDCCLPVVIGDRCMLEREIRNLKAPLALHPVASPDRILYQSPITNYKLPITNAIIDDPAGIPLLEVSHLDERDAAFGKPTPATGRALAAYIIKAVALARSGAVNAVVTAPINKQSLHEAGYDFPGHTEMLARLTGATQVVMMLAGARLRVVLVTIHCALARVPSLISKESILTTLRITHAGLRDLFGLPGPRIAVAGLNPHAGEAGMFGREEQEIILPAVSAAQAEGIAAEGPFPPDTVFYRAAAGEYDAVVCMYHDQGLIPLKLLHFDDGVNVTLGLPVIRTSVDHGTAYDIAGKGMANPASMLQAVRTAAAMVRARAGIAPAA